MHWVTHCGQDRPNPALGLATRAVKMTLSCLLVTTGCVPQENSVLFPEDKSFIDQASSVKILDDIGPVPFLKNSSFFWVFIDLDSALVHKDARKELGQYPAILTSGFRLVNKPYFQLKQYNKTKQQTDWRFLLQGSWVIQSVHLLLALTAERHTFQIFLLGWMGWNELEEGLTHLLPPQQLLHSPSLAKQWFPSLLIKCWHFLYRYII